MKINDFQSKRNLSVSASSCSVEVSALTFFARMLFRHMFTPAENMKMVRLLTGQLSSYMNAEISRYIRIINEVLKNSIDVSGHAELGRYFFG